MPHPLVALVLVVAGETTNLVLGAVALFVITVGITATIVLRRNRARMDRPDDER